MALGSFTVKRILVPTDFSRTSRIAIQYALAFAKQSGARVTLLHVVPTKGSASAGTANLELEEELKRGGAKQLSALIQTFAGNEVSADMVVRIGNPTVEIVHAARELKADLIIVSTHGRTRLKHLLLGSVAEGVIQHSPCPVLAVRKREHGFLSSVGEAAAKNRSAIAKARGGTRACICQSLERETKN